MTKWEAWGFDTALNAWCRFGEGAGVFLHQDGRRSVVAPAKASQHLLDALHAVVDGKFPPGWSDPRRSASLSGLTKRGWRRITDTMEAVDALQCAQCGAAPEYVRSDANDTRSVCATCYTALPRGEPQPIEFDAIRPGMLISLANFESGQPMLVLARIRSSLVVAAWRIHEWEGADVRYAGGYRVLLEEEDLTEEQRVRMQEVQR